MTAGICTVCLTPIWAKAAAWRTGRWAWSTDSAHERCIDWSSRPFPGREFPGVLRALWTRGDDDDRRDLLAFGRRYRRLASKGHATTAEDVARFRVLLGYARALVDGAADNRCESVRGLLWTTRWDDWPNEAGDVTRR